MKGKKPCRTINPDEAVAFGATVQAAILKNQVLRNESIPVLAVMHTVNCSLEYWCGMIVV